MKQSILALFLCLGALLVTAPLRADADRQPPPPAEQGVLDLGAWLGDSRDPLELAGQWEFYWQALLSPQDFEGPSPPRRTGWFTMPGVWNGTLVNGRKLGGQGFATFRLRLRWGPRGAPPALLIPYAFTAYRLWVDDRLAAAAGTVGTTAAEMVPGYRARVVYLLPGERSGVTLTLQVSNFMHAKGGLRAPIRLVAASQVAAAKHRALAQDVLVFACLLIMSIYHLALFAYRPADRSNVYFALCCLLFGIRAGLTGEVILLDLFANLDWRLAVRLEWLCAYTGAPLCIAFVRSLYPQECPVGVHRASLAFGAIMGLVTLLGPTLLFTGMFPYLAPLIGLKLGFCVWVLIRATRHKRFGAVATLASLTLVIALVVNDLLYTNELVQTGNYIPYGMLLFVFSQAMILAQRSARAFQGLEATNAAYAREFTEKERAQAEVKAYQDRLEYLVRERTTALAVANRRLQQELDERRTAEAEKQKLQERLQRAQKMEALGALAGGVAHDLNNILSGVVGYPDLLLQDLSPESPLHKPLQTIQQSGRKAAAIVQDLLTLARRGVADSLVLDVNRVVTDYLESPEFARLIQFHPEVEVESRLAPDLLPVKGSAVHLFKTVMNLVSNAAEAMPNGGRLRIETLNRRLDLPATGYETMPPGDYAVLVVSDTGIGISADDIERIFEPFYSKKVMGRSGTGLGMAVVWGTVKDHRGYIDVSSREGAGTTFTLCFPVTREAPRAEAAPWCLEKHRGRGEIVLVVDDVAEQREIAAGMLTRLGYRAEAVASGEAALELVTRRPVDLLLLDMIMGSGMDGLDTYDRILAVRPGQKAIIASGYAETGRVHEALQRGPAAYLKKPYRLENLAEALKAVWAIGTAA